MTVRENDLTKGVARPAVIIAALRSGGTFLAHCLSNHSQVFCGRGEPLHHLSPWYTELGMNRGRLLRVLLNQTGYQVSMCKLTYMQAFHREIWPDLVRINPLVLWLRRENVVRQAVSLLINHMARKGLLERPQHTFAAPKKACAVEISPELVLKTARGLVEWDQDARKRLDALAVCELTYAEVVGSESKSANRLPTQTGRRISKFLEVRYEALRCDLKRVNPYPLRELLSNWSEVEKAVLGSELAGLLEDEWTS